MSVLCDMKTMRRPCASAIPRKWGRELWEPRSEVVEPPLVETLSVKLYPPEYTGWAVVETEERIRAVKGTRVEIAATTDKPLRSARVVIKVGTEEPVELTAELTPDGRGFVLSASAAEGFVVQRSGSYWFRLEDTEGFPGGGDVRYDVRADTDLPPTVALEGASYLSTSRPRRERRPPPFRRLLFSRSFQKTDASTVLRPSRPRTAL